MTCHGDEGSGSLQWVEEKFKPRSLSNSEPFHPPPPPPAPSPPPHTAPGSRPGTPTVMKESHIWTWALHSSHWGGTDKESRRRRGKEGHAHM